MASVTAFLDASVLYPAPLRDLLMELAVSDLYRAKWSNGVHDEWIDALLQARPDLGRSRLERTRALMNTHVRDALVADYADLIELLDLPDPGDRHVLAAAIKGRADLIVTANLKDFPQDALARWQIEAQHPDRFLSGLFQLSPLRFLESVKAVRSRLRNPSRSEDEYLDTLRKQGLPLTVDLIAPLSRFI